MKRLSSRILIRLWIITMLPVTLIGQVAGDYRSHQSGYWNDVTSWERFDGTSWVTPAPVTPDSTAGQITVLGGHSVQDTLALGVDQVTIEAGASVIVSGTPVVLTIGTGGMTVQGTLKATGIPNAAAPWTINPIGTLTIAGGGTYEHNQNGGGFPSAIWSTGSTCLVTGPISVTSIPAGGNQNFYHLTWNCPGQTSNCSIGAYTSTIAGNVTVVSTGLGRFYFMAGSSGTARVLGDFIVQGGNWAMNGTGSQTFDTVHCFGNLTVTGGTFSITRGSQSSGTGTSVFKLYGDLSVTNASVQNSNGTNGKLVFSRQGTQGLALSNVTYGTGTGTPFNIDVATGSTLNLGANNLGASPNYSTGSFRVLSGATIISGHAAGINGNITCTGASGGGNSFSSDAGYTFNGSVAQVTGSFLPGAIANLTINNANGVTLTAPATVNGTLDLVSGNMVTGANILSMGAAGTVTRTDGQVVGNLAKNIPVGSNVLATFETGSGNIYAPVTVTFTSVGTSGFLVAATVGNEHPNIETSGIDSTKDVNRYWSLTNNGIGFTTCDVVLNFSPADIDAGANPGIFVGAVYSGGSWSGLSEGVRTATSMQVLGLTGFGDLAVGQPIPSTAVSNGAGGGNWANTSTWQGGAVPNGLDSVVIRGSDSVFVLANAVCAGLLVQSGGRLGLSAKLSPANVSLEGKVFVFADTLAPSGAMNVGGSGTYNQAENGGRLPTATWGTGSTCLISGAVANAPSNGNQSFHNVIWDCSGQAANLNMGWNNITIGGNITILGTGSGRWQLCAPPVDSTANVTILGDVIQSGGSFTTNGTGNGNTTIRIYHYGGISVTGGNFSVSRGSQGGSGTATWTLFDGNFSMSNATTQNSNPTGARFVFTRAGAQTLSLTSVTFAGGGLPIVIDSGTTLNTGTSVIRGSGPFTLNATATLACGHPGGLDSLLENTGTRTLSPGGNYIFNGSSGQVTGFALPALINNLTINNTNGVALSDSVTVNGTLSTLNGDLDLSGNLVTLGPVATLIETPGNTVTGLTGVITATRTLNAPTDTVNIAGLGISIGSAANLGSTVVTRGHAPQMVFPGSMKRFFDITPANNAGLNANFRFRYDDSELNGADESSLWLYRSPDGGVIWSPMGGIVDTAGNTITLAGVGSFSRWTAGVRTGLQPPFQVVPVSPLHGATVHADSVLCIWNETVPMVTNYWFERATDSLFTANRVVDSTLTDTSTVTRQLVTNTTYWWRVRAKNLAGWSPFSVARKFIVIITGIDEAMQAPYEFSLAQNYPNPFNPTTSIRFSVERTGWTTLEVFNILGQKVSTLFDGIAEAGRYHWAQFSAADVASSGAYFYRLTGNGKAQVRKLMLLR